MTDLETRPDWELTDEEFDALPVHQQRAYLRLLRANVEAWRLFPKQQEAHDRSRDVDELLYGGAAGPGKTEAMVYHVWDLSIRHPGHHALLIRKTHPNLRRSLVRRCHARFDPDVCNWRAADKEYHFDNGSLIEFGFCEGDDDVQQYLSAEYDFIGFEEATELNEYQLSMISTRCRTTVKKAKEGIRPHIWYTTNPGGPGHSYLKRRFVDPTDRGAIPIVEEPVLDADGEPLRDPRTNEPIPPRKVAFIPTTVHDNPAIDSAYLARLNRLPDVQRRMYLYGDWDVFEGQFFTEFNRETHVVDLAPSDVPESWPRWCAADWGFSAPWACLWFAADPDGNVVVYRELYEAGRTTQQQAADWKTANGRDQIRDVYADPAAFKDGGGKGTGLSTAGQWREKGLRARPAKNDRLAGWSRVREYLKPEYPPTCLECDGEGCGECEGLGVRRLRPLWAGNPTAPAPAVYISHYCRGGLIDELIGAQFDKTRTEDLDTKLEWKVGTEKRGDHALDALRYGLMVRPPRRPHTAVEQAAGVVRTAADILKSRSKPRDRGWTSHPNPADS